MHTLRILDHYRLSILTRSELLQLLSHLLRDGPQQADVLAKSTNLDARTADRSLTQLFRASMVEQASSDIWRIAPLGEQVLDSLELVDTAAVDLVSHLAADPRDRDLLDYWVRDCAAPGSSRTFLSLLRFFRRSPSLMETGMGMRSTLLYALMTAADPSFHGPDVQFSIHDPGEIAKMNLNRLLQQASHANSPIKDTDAKQVEHDWTGGQRCYLDSNLLLFGITSGHAISGSEESILLTWLRAMDAAFEGNPDEGFRTSCAKWSTYDHHSFWNGMFERSVLANDARTLFRLWYGVDEPRRDVLIEELSRRLREALTSASGRSLRKLFEPSGVADFEALANTIAHGAAELRRQGVSVVGGGTKERLRVAVSKINALLSKEDSVRAPEQERAPDAGDENTHADQH